MKKGIIKNYLWPLSRTILGAIFIYAAVYKIGNPGAFAHQVYNYKILPSFLINPAAIILPWLQLLCGLALVAGRWTLGASFWILVMMAAFQAGLASALIRGLNVACGCFKSGGSPATWWTFGRDFLILVLAAVVAWKVVGEKKLT